MKLLLTTVLLGLGLSTPPVFADNARTTKADEARNMALITNLYKEVYETKDFNKMDKYLSSDVELYKNLSPPLNYAALKKHLVELGSECVKINMLPFESILASGNKVVTLYTRSCVDKDNNKHERRVMAISEINNQHVSKITIVTHEENN